MTFFQKLRGIKQDPLEEALGIEPYRIKRSLWSRITPPYTGGSCDTVFGVPIYGNVYYDEPWFKWTFRVYHRFLRRVDGIWNWFHYRFRNRIHVVKTDLAPGWCDVDEVMFRACFALLGRYVEKELGPFRLNNKYHHWESHYRGYRLHSQTGDKEAVDLWLWYKYELPEIERLYDEDIMACYGGDDVMQFGEPDELGTRPVTITPKAERKYPYDWPGIVKDEKLRELIDLRRSLWT